MIRNLFRLTMASGLLLGSLVVMGSVHATSISPGPNSNPVITSGTASSSPIPQNQSTTFTWTAADIDLDALSWTVNWGDNTVTATNTNAVCQFYIDVSGTLCPKFRATHAWAAAGTYIIGVSVSDGKGGTASQSLQVIVAAPTSVNNNPVVTSGVAPANPIAQNGMETFVWTVDDVDRDQLQWSVNWGDGTPEKGGGTTCIVDTGCPQQTQKFFAEHGWSKPGNYTVQFTVTDGQGGKAASTLLVIVADPTTLALDAKHAGGSFPTQTTFKQGESTSVTVVFKNTGNSIWKAGQVILYPWPLNNSDGMSWRRGSDSIGVMLDTDISPGQEKSFVVGLTAPHIVGINRLQWRLYKVDSTPNRDIAPFGDIAPSTPLVWTVTVAANQPPPITISNVSGPSSLAVGEAGTWWITASDPMGTNVELAVRWGDGDTNEWISKNGEPLKFTHTYRTEGTHQIYFSASNAVGPKRPTTETGATVKVYKKQNGAPVIKQVSGPKTLKIREKGTWYVKAVDPENGQLAYSVVWGDESDTVASRAAKVVPLESQGISQTATFTHYYEQSGTYSPEFAVTDEAGLSIGQAVDVRVSVAVPADEQRTGSIKIAVVDKELARRIRCKTFPCAELKTAKAVVYALNGDELGDFVGSSDTSDGLARFYNLPEGKYVAYADAPGYEGAKEIFKIVGDDGRYLTIGLKKTSTQTDDPTPVSPPDFPDAFTPALPDGSLIQLQRTKGVYYIENGQKRPIRSRSVFNARGFDLSDVIIVDKTDFDRYPTGNELGAAPSTTPPTPVTPTTPIPGQPLSEGSLVKALGDKAVYRIESGKRRPFLSGSVFESRGYYWSDIVVVSPETLNAYPLGEVLGYQRLGDGFLIKSPRSPSVYWTTNGQKQHIANERVFAAHAFRWQDIHVISEEEIATYPTGPDMDW